VKIPHSFKISIIQKFFRNEITEERTYFALTLITGAAAGVIAVSLSKLTHYLMELFGTNAAFTKEALFLGGLSILISGFLTTRFYPSTSGSGIPGVRVSLAVYHGKITIHSTIAKFVTSTLSLASGISLGREGPTVAIASGLGSYLGYLFHLSKKRVKALVAIGSAGGIAAAFNTPIAAVVFTLEEIVGDLNAKVLGSIIISSVVASVTASALQGNNFLFSTLDYSLQDPRELLFYLVVGILCSIIGPLWMNSVLKVRELNLKIFKGHKLTIILLTFFLMALLSQIDPAVLGSGHQTLEEALLSLIKDNKVIVTLFLLKFVATSICYSSGVSGGLFLPTLMMGAMLGSLVGNISHEFYPGITSNVGAYALVGMGAYFAAVIRAPFTSIIMVFELTRDYNIMLPLMIANVTSYFISSKFTSGSIYERISEQDGIHLPSREDHDVLETLLVEEAMITKVKTLNATNTIKETVYEIVGKDISGYPVLRNGRLVGMISTSVIAQNYAKGNKELRISEVANKRIVHVYRDQSLLVAFHKLKKYQISRLPVVSRLNDKDIIGIITAENIVSQFGYHLQDEQPKEFNLENLELTNEKSSKS
jgi:chloride channel protein, CIC family